MEVTREEAESFETYVVAKGYSRDYLRAVVRALDGEHVCKPSQEFVEAVRELILNAEEYGCHGTEQVRAVAAKEGI